MYQKSNCQECGGDDLSWDMIIRGPSEIQDGRYRANEMRAIFFLGCNYCSATVQTANEDQIIGTLNEGRKGAQP